ncbi:zinc-binding dehydrogenase [Spongiactinospora sp. TRM90649]|uniref:zinc-binding dehydrogenase n=1 Tax=Spongiactinospora sp. TRM90649 TaxID=3031114 RepID=UPI0023F6F928|nr:zinc-binding dehydrogenase [Spongiactinospora sp. TRM90649]MDF5753216.1 zinc-binding dehydrogenase [Spongiactinospora sp. TRM90649]
MRAIRFHEYGPADVLRLEETPDPVPGADELLIRVEGAGVSFVEVQIRGGLMPQVPLPLPFTPGFEIGGTVVAAGPGADQEWVGRRVLALSMAGGGYAELAVVPAAAVRALPDGLALDDGLAMLASAPAAIGALDAAAIRPGETVLVEAATGAVGGLLVQLAKDAGARVVAAVKGERKLAFAEELGADAVVDYGRPGWDDEVRKAAGGDVAVVFETVGGEVARTAFGLLAPGTGRMIIYGTAGGTPPELDVAGILNRGLTVRGFASVLLPPAEVAALQDRAFAYAADGRIKAVTGVVLPLAEAAAAHRAYEERTTIGKTVLRP